MDGLKILNQITETHYTYGTGTLIVGIIATIIALPLVFLSGYFIIDAIKTKKIEDIGAFCGSIILTLLFCVLSTCMFDTYFTRTEYKTTKYQVTIDDSVKMNEFNSKYNIISHDGNIYIIENKLENELHK